MGFAQVGIRRKGNPAGGLVTCQILPVDRRGFASLVDEVDDGEDVGL